MKAPSFRTARLAFVAGAALVSSVAVVGVSSPAFAADLGTLTVSPTSGSVTANPIFTSITTSAACPTGYGTNAVAKVGPVGGPYNGVNRIGSENNYDAAPFTLTANRSFETAMGTVPAPGNYEFVVVCTGEILGDNVNLFRLPITVTGGTWKVAGAVEQSPTTTTLTANPAGPAEFGTEVTLTAAVTPADAAGAVEFKRGGTSLGTAPVANGSAALKVGNLPIGTQSLTAVFTPSAATLAPSTSQAISFQVTAPAGGANATQELIADVAPGAFSLDLAGNSVALAGGLVGGAAAGDLNKATVTDLRGTNAGWDLVGQSGDFVNGTNTIASANLGWTPNSTKVDASGTVVSGDAGNLGEARTLCKAAAGTSAGVFECGAALNLSIPDSVAPGSYAATLTLTLA